MSYDQANGRLERASAEANASSANIARQIYEPGGAQWNWNLNANSLDTASSHLPAFDLNLGSTGPSPWQNAAFSGQGEDAFRQWGANAFNAGANGLGDGAASGTSASNSLNDASVPASNAASGATAEAQFGSNSIGAEFQQLDRQIENIAWQIGQIASGLENLTQQSDVAPGAAATSEAAPGAAATTEAAPPAAATSEAAPPAAATTEAAPPAAATTEAAPPAAATTEAAPPAAVTTEATPAASGSAAVSPVVSAPEATSPTPPPLYIDLPASGGLTVQNGQLLENGQPFTPGGVAANPSDVVNNPNFIQTLIGSGADQFNANFIRLAMNPADSATETVQAAQQIEAAAQTAGKPVVVEIEQHNTEGQTLTGSALSQAEALYSQMAGMTAGNSNIIYGTPNEPSPDGSPTQEQDYVNMQTGIIGAIRSAGNSSAVMVEGGDWGNPLGNTWLQDNAATFEQAAGGNAIGDLHVYINDSAQVAPIESVVGQLSQAGMPSIVGEYGNAGDGTPNVPNSPGLVYQIQQDTGVGNVGWELFPAGSPENSYTASQGYGDVFYNGSSATQLNQYGVQILQHLNPGGVTAADENAPAVGAT